MLVRRHVRFISDRRLVGVSVTIGKVVNSHNTKGFTAQSYGADLSFHHLTVFRNSFPNQ